MSVRVDFICQLERACGKIKGAVIALEAVDHRELLDMCSVTALNVAEGRLKGALSWIESAVMWEKHEREAGPTVVIVTEQPTSRVLEERTDKLAACLEKGVVEV